MAVSSLVMSVMVRLNGRKAIFRGGTWVASDPGLELLLNDATEEWIRETGGPPLWDRDPEKTAAKAVIEKVGARLTAHVPSPGKKTRQLFFARRQFRLDF